MGTREIVLAVVIPGAVSAAVMLAIALAWRRRTKRHEAGEDGNAAGAGDGPFWIVPVLMAGAVMLGAYAWQTDLSLWPDSVTHRFPVIAIAALAAAIPALIPPLGWRLLACGVVGIGIGGFGAWAFLGELHESLISESSRTRWIAAAAVVCGVAAVALEGAGAALRGWRGPLLLCGLLGTVALGATAGFANAPLILGAAAVAVGPAVLAGVLLPGANLVRGSGAAAAVLVVSTVVFSNWFGDTERWLMLGLLWAASVAPGVVLLPGVRKLGPTVKLVIAGVLVLGLAGAQAGMALPALIEATTGSSGSEYGEYDY